MDAYVSIFPFQTEIVDESLYLAEEHQDLDYSISIVEDDCLIEPARRHFDYAFSSGDLEEGNTFGDEFEELTENSYVVLHGRQSDLEEYRAYLSGTLGVEEMNKEEGRYFANSLNTLS